MTDDIVPVPQKEETPADSAAPVPAAPAAPENAEQGVDDSIVPVPPQEEAPAASPTPVNDARQKRMTELFGDIEDRENASVEDLREELDELGEQLDDLTGALSMTQADARTFRNERDAARKALEVFHEEAAREKKGALGKFMQDFLPVIDAMGQSLQAAEKEKADDLKFSKLVQGFESTLNKLTEIFNKYGVKQASLDAPPAAEKESAAPPKDAVAPSAAAENLENATAEDLCASIDEMNVRLGGLATSLAKAQKEAQLLRNEREEARKSLERARREAEQEKKFAVEKALKDLMPVIDTVELGLKAAEKDKSADPKFGALAQGIGNALTKLSEVFGSYGVQQINPVGEAFDSQKHEVITTMEKEGAAPETIVQVAQKGYEIHGRIVRYAKVVVTPS